MIEPGCKDYKDKGIGYYDCGKFHIRSGAVAGIVIGAVIIGSGVFILFTYCLKKRLINGKKKFLCRKSTWKLLCFHRKPLTMEEKIKKDKRKERRAL